MESMYSYTAYNLIINSDLSLPELIVSAARRPDVTIRFGQVSQRSEAIDFEGIFRYYVAPTEADFFWDDIASFHVRDGREIVIDLKPGADEEMVRILLLGAVFSVLLHQRGLLVLHASAVVVNHCALAFIGGKGWGKSTLAATLYGRGHELLADDVVALRFDESNNPVVLPGFPQIKLWPEAVAASIGQDPDNLPRVAAKFEKRTFRAIDRFSRDAYPLRGIYFLADSDTPECVPLGRQQALTQLIGASHIARFGKQGLSGAEAVRNLQQCANTARNVPMYYLKRPRSLAMLPAVARLLEDEFIAETSETEMGSLVLV